MIASAPTCSPSDADLLTAFVQGREPEAFSQLVARHGGMVLAVCRSVLGNTPDAEDAAQAVFLTLAQKAPSQHVHGSLAGWLHRVGWYVATRSARARAIRRQHEQEAARMKREFPPPSADGDPIPLDVLHAGLADLPEKYRVPLLLHHLEGRTQEETAALLGCGVSAVAMRLNRGREMLRKRLARRGLAASSMGVVGTLSSHVHGHVAPGFVVGTTKAATALLAGHVTGSGLSASALALRQGAMHMLFWSKIKSIAAAIAMILLVGGVGTVVVRQAVASSQTAPQPSITGTISQVGTGSITLHTASQSVTVTLNTATIVKVNGTLVTPGDLKVGMTAIAFGSSSSPATEIRAYTPKTTTQPTTSTPPAAQPNVAGTITQVGSASVTIQSSTSQSVVVPFDTATVVNVGGKAATSADLKVGMRAYAIVPSGKAATTIRAYTPTTTTATAPASVKQTITGVAKALPAYNPAKMDPAIANATVTVTENGAVTVYYVYGWAGIICAQNSGKTVEVTGTVGKTTAGQTTITAASVNVKVIIVQ